MTPLSGVITSFHLIERHSIHPLGPDTNETGQTKSVAGRGCRGLKMKREGWTVWRQGNKGKRGGGGEGLGGRKRGVDDSDAHHSRVCVRTPVRFWKKKRAALQRHSPPASHPSSTSMPLFLGHLWAGGVGSGGIETACALTYYHIQLQSKLCAMALKEIFLFFFFFFSKSGIKEAGPLIAVKADPRCLFNMHSQALSHLVGLVLTNK